MGPKKIKGPLFQPRDMVLAKMAGFPAWPSFVMPPELIPPSIMKAKKKTTNTCVIFIPDGDFNWMNEKSLEALSREKLQAKLDKAPKDKARSKTKKKSTRTNNVVDALIAASDLQFEDFMAELHKAKVLNDDETNQDEIENGDGIETGTKIEEEILEDNKQATEDLSDKIDNKEDEDAEEETADKENASFSQKKPQRSTKNDTVRGKRKSPRSNLSNAAEVESPIKSKSEPAAKPKLEPAIKISPSNSSEDDVISKSENGSENADEKDPVQKPVTRKRTRTNGAVQPITPNSSEPRSTRDVETEASPDEPAPKRSAEDVRAESPKPMDAKERQQQLWLCRIRLQRSLIQRNQPVTPKDPKSFPPPTEEELSMAKAIMEKLVDFPVTVDLLRDTKIHKVLKCILKDPDLELQGTYNLHQLCKTLLAKWHDLVEILRQSKALRPESRIGSSAPENSEVSRIAVKPL